MEFGADAGIVEYEFGRVKGWEVGGNGGCKKRSEGR